MVNSKPQGLRIVFFNNSVAFNPNTVYSKGLGGSESALIYLARELARIGHQVYVFCNCDGPGEYDGVTYQDVSGIQDFLTGPPLDVFISVRNPLVCSEPIRTNLMCLWTGDSYDQPHIQPLLQPDVADQVDAVITVSHWQSDSYRKYFGLPENKFFSSRNGFHEPFFSDDPGKPRPNRLVYTSTPFRGLDVLLDLFPEIRNAVPDAELHIYSSMAVYGVSKEEDEKLYGALYRKAEQPGVTLVGSIDQKRLARELMQAKILSYPNHFAETSCIAAIEAQAAGVPVVTTDLGGLNETVQDGRTGILIPGDSRTKAYGQRFVREVVCLLKDQGKWRTFSQQARQRAFAEYRWEVIANEWSQRFTELLTHKKESCQKESSVTLARTRQIGGSNRRVLAVQKEIEKNPDNPDLYNRLGLEYLRCNEPKKALPEFRKAIERHLLFEEACENYIRTAQQLGLPLVRKDLDIVFYAPGNFNDDSLIEEGIGGSESAVIHMSRALTLLGRKVLIFNETDRPGVYNGIEYRPQIEFFLMNRVNRVPIFISSRMLLPFQVGVRAEHRVLWAHDDCRAQFLHDENISGLDIDEIFVLSRWHKETWSEHFGIPLDRFFLTRNGFNPEDFDRLRGSEKRNNKIIYASRPGRGLEVLLDLFPAIRQAVPSAELHIFTYTTANTLEEDPELAPHLPKMRHPGIYLRGSLPKPAFYRELLSARVMAYPSIWRETSCIAAIEAQAAGLPVVTSALAALPETVQGGITLPGDPSSADYRRRFVSEVCALLTDDVRWNTLSRKGSEFVRTHYPWSRVAAEWIDHWNSGSLPSTGEEEQHEERPAPRLSLCMIVKNEEAMLPGCMESVQDLVDEMIVVDTGSTDRTTRIAEGFGARVIPYTWNEDFSKARNFSIDQARGEWILVLDADERISPKDHEILRRRIENPSFQAYDLLQRNYTDDSTVFGWVQHESSRGEGKDYRGYFDVPITRLFRKDPKVRFRNRVHERLEEVLDAAGIEHPRLEVAIHHYGKVRSVKFLKDKLAHYLDLSRAKLEESPGNARASFEIGGTLLEMGRTSEAIEPLQEACRLEPDFHDAWKLLGIARFQIGDFSGAFSAVAPLTEQNEDPALADLLGTIALRLGQWTEAAAAFRKAHQADPGQAKYLIGLAQAEAHTGNLPEAGQCLDHALELQPNSAEALNDRGCLFQMEGNFVDAERFFRRALSIDPEHEGARLNLNRVNSSQGVRKTTKESRHLLSLCMIVKNEEQRLHRCLESVRNIVDELIIVDTGSTDSTVEIAESFGAKVFQQAWTDDFSAARNRSIEEASGKWILVLDADEFLAPQGAEAIRKCIGNTTQDGFFLEQRNYTDDDTLLDWAPCTPEEREKRGYGGYVPAPIIRLFRRGPRIRFRGRLHELVEHDFEGQQRPVTMTRIPIHHFGKVLDADTMNKKREHYLEICRKKIEENPQNGRSHFELGALYTEAGDDENALPCFEEAARLSPDDTLVWLNLGSVLRHLDRLGEAEAAYRKGIQHAPGSIDLRYHLGLTLLTKGNMEEAIEECNRVLAVQPAHGRALWCRGVCHERRGETAEAEKTFRQAIAAEPNLPAPCNHLGCLCAQQSRFDEAIDWFRKLLNIDPDHSEGRKNLRQAIQDRKKGFFMNKPTDQASTPRTSSPDETISLCMIVKNEEEQLARCLDSVQGHVDEIIIVDTGSTDTTIEIARKYTDKVYQHPWENDFSRSRNQSLRYATSDWILILDADEQVEREDGPRLKEVIQGHQEMITHLSMDVLNYRSQGEVNAVLHSIRIFRNRRGFHYEGIVHNQLRLTDQGVRTPLRIHHYGYALTEEEMEAKKDRTIALLQKQIEKDPQNPWPMHNLCISYSMAGMQEKAVEAGQQARALADKQGTFPPYLYYSRYVVASIYCAQNKYDQAMKVAEDCLAHNPDHLDSYYLIAMSAYEEDRFELVRKMGEAYLQCLKRIGHVDALSLIAYGTLGYRDRMEKMLGHAYFALGNDDLAARMFQTYINHDGRDPDRLKDIGLFYHGKGRTREAQEQYHSYLSLRPEDTYILKAVADCLCKEKRDAESLPYYEKVLALDPNDKEALYLKESIREGETVAASPLRPAEEILTQGRRPDTETRETISLCMIVKDEEKMLPDCVESVKDYVDEIIIVDTGSSDRTVEIAKQYTDKVYFHPWENDFSKARNWMLRYAESDWIIYLDADERLDREDGPRLKEAIQDHSQKLTHLYVDILNYDSSGSVNTIFHAIRVFRNRKDFYFEGIVHNQLRLTGEGIRSALRFHHYGYALNETKMEAKSCRTIALIQKQIKEDPENPWPMHNLCISYSMAQMEDEAVEAGMHAKMLADRKGISPPYLYYSRYVVASIYCAQKKYDQAIEVAQECLKHNPDHLDSYYVIALSAYQEDRLELAREMGESYLRCLNRTTDTERPSMTPYGTLEFQWKMEKIMGDIYFNLGEEDKAEQMFRSAIAQNPEDQESLKDIALFYHRQGRTEEAEQLFLQVLKINEDEPQTLISLCDIYLERGNLDACLFCCKTLLRMLGLPADRTLNTREDLSWLFQDIGTALLQKGWEEASGHASQIALNLSSSQTVDSRK